MVIGSILFYGYFSMLMNTVMSKKSDSLKLVEVLLLLSFDPFSYDCKYMHRIFIKLGLHYLSTCLTFPSKNKHKVAHFQK